MIKLLLQSTILLLGIVTYASAQISINIKLEGVKRHFNVYKPTGQVPAGGYPLVFMLHGRNGNGNLTYQNSQWKELAEKEKFVAVFPSSLAWCVVEDGVVDTSTRWANGELYKVLCAGETIKNDVLFVSTMIDTISSNLSINKRKIFCAGFSNGATMSAKLGMESSTLFTATASCSGSLTAEDSITPQRAIPTWFMIGTRDANALAKLPGLKELPFNDSILVVSRVQIQRYLDLLQLQNIYTLDTTNNVRTYTYSTPKQNAPAALFKLSIIKNMTHQYPTGEDYPLVAANMHWNFFVQSALATTDASEIPEHISLVFPNPASSNLTFPQAEANSAVTIVNSIGKQVLLTTLSESKQISIAELPNGVYAALINNKSIPFVVAK